MNSCVSLAVTIGTTYYTTSFMQAFLHRELGHRPMSGSIYRTHTLSHHAIYSGDNLLTDSYSADEESLTATYLAPSAILAVAAYAMLPMSLFLAFFSTVIVSFAAHVHLHAQYHLKNSWLASFKRFQRMRETHLVHHDDPSRNFSVMEPMCDRVMGTYRAPTRIVALADKHRAP